MRELFGGKLDIKGVQLLNYLLLLLFLCPTVN